MNSQAAFSAIASPPEQPPEQRVVLQGVSWHQYELLLATLGDDFPALRLSYLESTLEIMTNSPLHEELKTMIGMLMEAYFQETRNRFHGIGSATFRQVAKQRGLEPDFDVDLLASYVKSEEQFDAVMAFRDRLRAD